MFGFESRLGLVLAPALLLLSACPPAVVTDDTANQVVIAGPELSHDIPVGVFAEGEPIDIEVRAVDPDGIFRMNGWYRTRDDDVWETMILTGDGDGTWTGVIPGSDVRAPALEYYFKATDDSEHQAVSFLPDGGFDSPYSLDVQLVGASLPFVEDFEGSGSTVFSLGWFSYSQAFEGYPWGRTSTNVNGGSSAVSHTRGPPSVDPLDDWLVSPPLDLRDVERIELSWYQWGDYVGSAQHELWLSAGSQDPADGDFEFVQTLAAPQEDTWERSTVVDVSTWGDVKAGYLAFRYQGQFSDVWTIDDLVVREMRPDLAVTQVSWTDTQPGQPTTVTLDISNRTPIDALEVTLSPSIDAGLGVFQGDVVVGDIAGLGSASADLVLDIDAAVPDNSRVPFSVHATTSEGDSWDWDLELVVGERSNAHIVVTLFEDAVLSAALGVGDPAAPDLTIPVQSSLLTAGTYTWDVDITDHFDVLPPVAGTGRWWLRVDAEGVGNVTAFNIDYDGTSYISDDTGTFLPSQTRHVYLPKPANPTFTRLEYTPQPAQPDTTVDLEVWLENRGAETNGLTTATVISLDPDAVVNSGPVTLDVDGWRSNWDTPVDVNIDILATQDDSQPLRFEVLIQDEVESFTVPFELPVPWPVLSVTGVVVDDDDNDNGVLEPGETATLEVYLTNTGDLDIVNNVTCTLVQSGGAATATVIEASGSYGKPNAGETRDEEFSVEVTAGAAGDDIEFELQCLEASSGRTYTSGFVISLGEQPWVFIDPLGDSPGDAVNGYGFDFVGGLYRSDGATLEIILESDTPYNGATLFIESWSRSTGGAYDYYEMVSQSGALQMRGYDAVFGTFTKLSNPTIVELDAYRVLITIDLLPMDLAVDRLEVGFASGFCGGSTYYCDQFPDFWGSPYGNPPFNPGLWYELRW